MQCLRLCFFSPTGGFSGNGFSSMVLVGQSLCSVAWDPGTSAPADGSTKVLLQVKKLCIQINPSTYIVYINLVPRLSLRVNKNYYCKQWKAGRGLGAVHKHKSAKGQ